VNDCWGRLMRPQSFVDGRRATVRTPMVLRSASFAMTVEHPCWCGAALQTDGIAAKPIPIKNRSAHPVAPHLAAANNCDRCAVFRRRTLAPCRYREFTAKRPSSCSVNRRTALAGRLRYRVFGLVPKSECSRNRLTIDLTEPARATLSRCTVFAKPRRILRRTWQPIKFSCSNVTNRVRLRRW